MSIMLFYGFLYYFFAKVIKLFIKFYQKLSQLYLNFIKVLQKMGKFDCLKRILYASDLFCSSDMLRYNSQSQYKTWTGGLISLIMIIAVIIGFSNMIISSMERTSISSNLLVKRQPDPPNMALIPGQGNFMIGISIATITDLASVDLNNGPQMFDIVLKQINIQHGILLDKKLLKLQECTRQHWHMDPNTVKNFDEMTMGTYSCLQLNSNINLNGKYGSKLFSHLQYDIYQCQNTTQNNNKCASKEQIDNFFRENVNFYVSISYINPVINPNQPDYIEYSMNNQNYFIISKQIGAETSLQFSDFTINTDNSILPFEDLIVQKGFLAENKISIISYATDYKSGDTIGTVLISRSNKSLVYQREVLKISTVISYIGGMIGAIVAILFVVKAYADCSLQIAISLDVFKLPSNQLQDVVKQPKQQLKFNLFNYFSLKIFQILEFFKKGESFIISKQLDKHQDEINKQLDISRLLKRLLKIQLLVHTYFDDDQIFKIKNCKNISYQVGKQLRTLLLDQQIQDQQQSNKVSDSNLVSYKKSSDINFFNKQQCKVNDPITENPLKIQQMPKQCISPGSLTSDKAYFIQPHTNFTRKPTISMNIFEQKIKNSENHKGNEHYQDLHVRNLNKNKKETILFSAKDIIQFRRRN